VDVFGRFCDGKVKQILDKVSLDDNVYNGLCLVNSIGQMFMQESEALEYMESLKKKNSEGLDRIPQKILVDSFEILINPLARLFARIYEQKLIPDQ
jgi:hypothetical protein